VRAGAAVAGRAPESCRIALMLDVCLDEDPERALDALRPRCLLMAGGAYAEDLIPLYGLDPDPVLRLRAAVRARDPHAARLVSDQMVRAFAVGGPAGLVGDRLAELGAAGVSEIIVSLGEGVTADGIERLGAATKGALT
jgi:5,10-methylenetetrahydromethanopterin reductase